MNRTEALTIIKNLLISNGWVEVEILSPDELNEIDIETLRFPFWIISWIDAEHLPEHPEIYDLTISVSVINERFGHPRGQDAQLEVTSLIEWFVTELSLLPKDILPILGFVSTTHAPRLIVSEKKTLQRASAVFTVTTWDDEVG